MRLARPRLRSGEEARGTPSGSDDRIRNGSEAEKSRSRFSGSLSGGEGAGRESGRTTDGQHFRTQPPFGGHPSPQQSHSPGRGRSRKVLLPPWGRTPCKPMEAADGVRRGLLNPGLCLLHQDRRKEALNGGGVRGIIQALHPSLAKPFFAKQGQGSGSFSVQDGMKQHLSFGLAVMSSRFPNLSKFGLLIRGVQMGCK